MDQNCETKNKICMIIISISEDYNNISFEWFNTSHIYDIPLLFRNSQPNNAYSIQYLKMKQNNYNKNNDKKISNKLDYKMRTTVTERSKALAHWSKFSSLSLESMLVS